jgi:hypothetical protein
MALPGQIIYVEDDIQDVVEWSWYYSINGGEDVLGGTYECPFVEPEVDAPEGSVDVYTFNCPVTVPITSVNGDTIRFHFVPTGHDEGITDSEGNPVDFYHPAILDAPLIVIMVNNKNQSLSLGIGIGL